MTSSGLLFPQMFITPVFFMPGIVNIDNDLWEIMAKICCFTDENLLYMWFLLLFGFVFFILLFILYFYFILYLYRYVDRDTFIFSLPLFLTLFFYVWFQFCSTYNFSAFLRFWKSHNLSCLIIFSSVYFQRPPPPLTIFYIHSPFKSYFPRILSLHWVFSISFLLFCPILFVLYFFPSYVLKSYLPRVFKHVERYPLQLTLSLEVFVEWQ